MANIVEFERGWHAFADSTGYVASGTESAEFMRGVRAAVDADSWGLCLQDTRAMEASFAKFERE